jgi:hypothetical protein
MSGLRLTVVFLSVCYGMPIVDEVRLKVGDEIAIGPLFYRFEEQAAAPAGAPAVGAAGQPAPALARPAVAGPGAPAGPGWVLDDSDLDLIPLDDD